MSAVVQRTPDQARSSLQAVSAASKTVHDGRREEGVSSWMILGTLLAVLAVVLGIAFFKGKLHF